MKKLTLSILALCAVMICQAFPKAFYIVNGTNVYKYNFGVAGSLNFDNANNRLVISGYNEVIDLTKIDYISFSVPKVTSMTQSAQKQKMIDIADKFYNKFNIKDYQDAIFMCDHFINKYGDLSFDADVYFNVNRTPAPGKRSSLACYLDNLRKVMSGNVGYAPSMNSQNELWQASDFYGVFAPDAQNLRWTKVSTANDRLEFRFPSPDGETYYVKAVPSAEYTDWTEIDFTGRMPKTITVTGSKGSTVLWTSVIESKIDDQSKSADITVTTTVNNLKVTTINQIHNGFISDNTYVNVKGEDLLKAGVYVAGRDFTDYEKWEDDYNNMQPEYYDPTTGDWEDGDDFASDVIVPRVSYGNAFVDIMGELQVKGRVSNLKKLVDILSEDSDYMQREEWDYNKNECRVYDEDINVYERQAQYLNSYSDVAFYYDGDNEMQGYFNWDVDVDDSYSYLSDGYWDDKTNQYVQYQHTRTYVYYSTMPVLAFPDQTTIAIEDFFNRTDFNKLVSDYDRLIDDYYKIVGRPNPHN